VLADEGAASAHGEASRCTPDRGPWTGVPARWAVRRVRVSWAIAGAPRSAGLALAMLLVGVLGFAVTTTMGGAGASVRSWLRPMLLLLATGIVAARAWWTSDERLAWSLIAAGMFVPAVRSLLFPTFGSMYGLRPVWLCFYPFVFAGLLLLLRPRERSRPISIWLDALIAGTTVAAVAAVAFGPFRAATGQTPLDVVLTLGFPTGDLFLLAAAVGALSFVGWRVDPRWGVLVAGFTLYAVADVRFTVALAEGTYVARIWFDAFKPVAALLLAAASWTMHLRDHAIARPPDRGYAVPLLLFTATLVGLLVVNYDGRLPRTAVALAAVGLIAVTARFGLAFRDVRSLADSHHRAMTDDLTFLANRRAMTSALTAASSEYSASAEGAGTSTGPGVLLLDLDRFKAINDSLGHHAGDRLLRQVADRLSRAVREGDLCARVGGDEFAVLLPAATESAAARALAARIIDVLDEPFLLDEVSVRVEASIGVALCPEHCRHPEDLLERADVAMYRAKGLRARIALYDNVYDTQRIDERQAVSELRTAISAGQLVCHYQPKIRTRDGGVHSVEALVRWRHPTRGLLRPDQFLHYAERGGLMRPLATTVLNMALRQARDWRERGAPLTVAVNLSVTNLIDVDLIDLIGELLEIYRVPADALILEITEGVLSADALRSRSVVEALQRLGIKLSIDDFGTGWSSLARLHDISVDELKLDGVFIGRLVENPRSIAIVRSTVALAHSLGAALVAEGVEDVDTLDALTSFGCDITQGYLHCPPLPPHELDRWLDKRAGGSTTRTADRPPTAD
jgi:diguanylate cyclase